MILRRQQLSAALVVLAASLFGQGKENYLNFEPPENEALAIASIPNLVPSSATSSHYLLVANTTDDSVEIYNAVTNAFVARVPTGQAPIGVYVKPTRVLLNDAGYLATDEEAASEDGLADTWTLAHSVNWIGDSVTVIGLRHIQRSGTQFLDVRAFRTVWVGDEPTSLAFTPEVAGVAFTQPGSPFHEGIVLLHGQASTFDMRDAITVDAFPGGFSAINGNEMLNVALTAAVREAWVVKFRPGNLTPSGQNPSFIALNRRGGNFTTNPAPVQQSNYVQVNPDPNYLVANVNTNPQYDFDIFGPFQTVGGHMTATGQIGALGTTNYAMTWAPNGDVYVVGQIARNNDNVVSGGAPVIKPNGESIHAGMELTQSGFVQSMVWRIVNIGQPGQAIERLDLNAATAATPKITQPTSVTVLGNGSTGTRIFVTGFNSDSLAMITLGAGGLATSPITRVDLRHATQPFPTFNSTTNRLDGQMMGPRAQVILDVAGTPQKLFVLNKLDRSFYALDPNALPATPAMAPRIPLLNDPTPRYINFGRAFLYSSALSGNGTSSCASCHIDGGFDGLVWNLSAPPVGGILLPGAYPNAAVKGPMFTQSLKGLATFEVGSSPGGQSGALTNPGQRLFTTEPLHWRADKGFFEDFNAAFVGLLGMSNTAATPWVVQDDSQPDLNQGITTLDMDAFRDFTFSMHYPPNPEQPLDRTFSGDVGANAFGKVPPSPTPVIGTAASGSYGGQLGLELFFHDESESCVLCHAMPMGTDGVPSEAVGNPLDPNLPANLIETAALRGLIAKEKRLTRRGFGAIPPGGNFPAPFLFDVGAPPNPPGVFPPVASIGSEGAVIGEFGLTHTGNSVAANASETIKHFVHGFTIAPTFTNVERDATTFFMREFDTGVSPGIGFTLMVDAVGMANPAIAAAVPVVMGLMEAQVAVANVGVAVRARLNGVDRGFRFDLAANTYVEETFSPASAGALGAQTRAQLIAAIGGANPVGNSLTVIATPLGAERRFANVTTTPTSAVVAANGTVTGITLLPMIPNTAYARVPSLPNLQSFVPTNAASIAPQPAITKDAAHVILALFDPTGPLFNVPTTFRHQPARRFCLTGTNVLPGAKVRLYLPTMADTNTATPPSGGTGWLPPTTTPTTSTHEFIEMPIYPSNPTGNTIVFETAAELGPSDVYTFMLGGPNSIIDHWYGGSAVYNAAINHANAVWLANNFYNTAFITLTLARIPGTAPDLPTALAQQLAADLALGQGSGGALDPRRFNWYFVEVINTIRTTPTSTPIQVVSSGGWQRVTL